MDTDTAHLAEEELDSVSIATEHPEQEPQVEKQSGTWLDFLDDYDGLPIDGLPMHCNQEDAGNNCRWLSLFTSRRVLSS